MVFLLLLARVREFAVIGFELGGAVGEAQALQLGGKGGDGAVELLKLGAVLGDGSVSGVERLPPLQRLLGAFDALVELALL